MASSVAFAPSLSKFATPLVELQNRSEHVGKRLVIGVAIVRRFKSNISLPQVLVLQRAAHETLFPNMYELPGGKCEPTDSDLLATVVRETLEETAFKVLRVIAEFPGFEYSTSKGSAQQFNFVVEVEGGAHKDPILDPNEHQAFAWVDEGNFKTFSMSDAMTLVVVDALTAAKETMLEYSTKSHYYSS